MSLLDPRTTYLITALMYLCMPALVYLALRWHQSVPVKAWTAGGLLFGLGLLLIGLRGFVPDLVSFEIAMLSVLLGNGLRIVALRLELKRPPRAARTVGVLASAWAVYVALMNVGNLDFKLAFCWAALAIAAGVGQLSHHAWELYRYQALKTSIWLAIAYMLIAVLLVARVTEVLLPGGQAGPLQPGALANLVALAAIIACVVSNTSFLGFYAERENRNRVLRAEENARREEGARLARQIAHLERQRGLGLLAESLAHELSQPLANISLISDLEAMRQASADTAAASPSSGSAFADIQLNVRLASGVLDRVRLYSKDRQPEFTLLRIDEVAHGVTRMMGDWLQSESVELECGDGTDALTVSGDRVQLSQVLLNLIRNAAEATQGLSLRRIEIGFERQGDQVITRIRDNGPGFGADRLSHGISAFSTTKPGGMGLGLSISQQIARLHGGEIQLAQADGGGAEVVLTLPAAPAMAS